MSTNEPDDDQYQTETTRPITQGTDVVEGDNGPGAAQEPEADNLWVEFQKFRAALEGGKAPKP